MEVMEEYLLMMPMITLMVVIMDLAGMQGEAGRACLLVVVMGVETQVRKVVPLATIQVLHLLVEVLGIRSLLVGFHQGSLLMTYASTLEILDGCWMFFFQR